MPIFIFQLENMVQIEFFQFSAYIVLRKLEFG